MPQKTAILIDPLQRTITPVQLDVVPLLEHLKAVEQLLQYDSLGSRQLRNGDAAYFDDRGLYTPWEQQGFFTLPSELPYPLAGRWLIVRYEADEEDYDKEEQLADCASDIVALRKLVKWVEAKDVSIPSPTVTRLDKDGKPTSTRVLDGGTGTWTIDTPPGEFTL